MDITYNERSAVSLASPNQAHHALDVFFDVCKYLAKTYKQPLQLHYTESPYERTLHPHSTIQAYLNMQTVEDRARIISLLTGTQVVHDYPYYMMDSLPCNGIGHSVENGHPSISLATEDKWTKPYLDLFRHTIEQKEVIDPIRHENIFDQASAAMHDALIQKNLAIEKARLEGEIHSGKELWSAREKIFPNLVLGSALEAYLLSVPGGGFFNQLYKRLVQMNDYFNSWINGDFNRKGFPGDSRPESDTRLNQHNFKMNFEKKGDLDCQMHCEFYDHGFRIYFHPNTDDRKGYIGYIGKKIGA